ncbi:MAG: hypothetical protein ACK42D_03925 [Candidatus Paceibacteria bacterium]
MNVDVTVGMIAGFVQLVGYILYWKLVVTADGKLPNPLTWLMFGYGTFILTILEWDVGATWDELYLPAVCSLCGIGVAGFIWFRSYKTTGKRWPREWNMKHVELWDGMSLSLDLIITFGYVVAWAIFTWSTLNEELRYLFLMLFLLFSNISTVFNFVPILRDTRTHPGHEHWLPWAVWTLSYTLLAVETWNREGVVSPQWNWIRVDEQSYVFDLIIYTLRWLDTWDSTFTDWIWLLLFPVSNLAFHGVVALLALPGRQRRLAAQQPCE